MSKIAIVTDSTATIPASLTAPYPIFTLPQVLVWGGETYEDGIDIQPEEFYTRLKTSKTSPTTSQVTPGAFRKLFTDLLVQDYQILAILVGSKLSGTMSSACQAQEELHGAAIEIVDSNTVAMALGFIVLEAARAAQAGATLAECRKLVEAARSQVGVVFAVDTLEFLHRGGRIGGATKLLGTALNIKPILEIQDGAVEPIERVRTRAKSLQRLVEVVEERIAGRQPVRIATLHANARVEAEQLMEMMNGRFAAVEKVFSEVSPVVGTHTGPGTVGIAFMAGR